MKKQINWVRAVLALNLLALPLRAEVIQCAGILGNSGEQGATLVHFGEKAATGIGVGVDPGGSLWDRGGAGVLNRYAVDGRLLASYRIPSEGSQDSDTITAVGNQFILCLNRSLSTLAIDAPSGSSATPLKVEADQISLSSHDGWVAASHGSEVFLVNAAGEKKPVATLPKAPQGLELGPDGTVYTVQEGKAYRATALNGLTLAGSIPGERVQFLNGYVYGAGWHSTLRRFDADWQPAPGVVLGGNSGSFIGHVDEQAEIVVSRGMAKMGPGLFAVSGKFGTLHLLEWQEKEKRFAPIRRIGAVPACRALALDRQGRTWWLSGNWNWNDGPDTPMHFGVPQPDIFALAMQNSDAVVGYGQLWNKPAVLFGKLEKEVRMSRFETPTVLPKDAVAAAVTEQNKRPVLLVLEKTGGVTAAYLSDTGDYRGDVGSVQFITSKPVSEWTSLVSVNPDTLLGAGDGFVIELAREGDHWKETKRMNSWGENTNQKFGGPIWLSADSGRLWVSDAARHRVVCFDLASRRELAIFGATDNPGDNLIKLNTPRVIAARGQRAVLFDSGNQRLVKLEIKEK